MTFNGKSLEVSPSIVLTQVVTPCIRLNMGGPWIQCKYLHKAILSLIDTCGWAGTVGNAHNLSQK